MADANPPPQPTAASSTTPITATTATTTTASKPPSPPPKPQNPALKMMGLPNLPRKLPSRNWMIFWAITGGFASAIIYDRREKARATAKWRRVVAPLASESIQSSSQLPRKLTVYLESPPGDGLRVAQDHFIEYVKPVLAASGLDWEFVQGRQQGDVRAAVAEKIRRSRKKVERPNEELPKTDETTIEELRKRMGLVDYDGIKGDIVIGRHAWKEYMRGLHEGWLGSLDPQPVPEVPEVVVDPAPAAQDGETEKKPEPEEEKPKKPERPPQPLPYNSPSDYSSAPLPSYIPDEFSPSVTIPFPHRLGFSHTFVRLGRFLNRRKLADSIGRDVAAVCFAASREYRPHDEHTSSDEDTQGLIEQQLVLRHEERDWPKSFWKDKTLEEEEEERKANQGVPKEKIWTSDMVVDQRIVSRMRRFEIEPEWVAKAATVVVPEEEVEGWIKGSLRSLWRWGASSFEDKHKGPNVGNLNDD